MGFYSKNVFFRIVTKRRNKVNFKSEIRETFWPTVDSRDTFGDTFGGTLRWDLRIWGTRSRPVTSSSDTLGVLLRILSRIFWVWTPERSGLTVWLGLRNRRQSSTGLRGAEIVRGSGSGHAKKLELSLTVRRCHGGRCPRDTLRAARRRRSRSSSARSAGASGRWTPTGPGGKPASRSAPSPIRAPSPRSRRG